MSSLVTFKGANLPAVSSLSTALRAIEINVGPAGTAIIKMDKTGHWVFGADQTEVEEKSTWAINPLSFIHGFIAWGDGEVLGEKMVPIAEPLPVVDAAPHGSKKGWEPQIGLSMKCLSGDDAGLEARYAVTSVGGRKAVQALAAAIAAQVDKDQAKPVPVVQLKVDSYKHTKYGKIFTPVFEIVEWVSMDGESDTPAEESAASDDAAPARRRRSA